jgi:beta-glucosidase
VQQRHREGGGLILWGAATAAYQIEGSVQADGRGESVWDRFAATPGRIADGSTGEPADDHYRRFRQDVALMRDLGLQAYRFSIAWPRVQPEGRGPVNRRGLDFYQALVEELLAAGIRPFVTLFHWDLPQALQDRGGWTRRDTVSRYAEYADLVSRVLGDRVHDWITFNEPFVHAYVGHVEGRHAPGLTDLGNYAPVSHHLLLAHGTAVPAIRANTRGGEAQVGITLNLSPTVPATDRDEDVQAATIVDGAMNRWHLDPVLRGGYPQDVAELLGFDPDPVDLVVISTPLDFLGVNYYTRTRVAADPEQVFRLPGPPEGAETTAMGWSVEPDGLHEILTRVNRDYAPARVYVTENGAAYDDEVDEDGRVRDPRRVAYLEAHIEQLDRARADGVPVEGYFAWSLLDNWEWAEGYTKRFGLVHVAYDTQVRTVKDSGRWYAELIRRRSGSS